MPVDWGLKPPMEVLPQFAQERAMSSSGIRCVRDARPRGPHGRVLYTIGPADREGPQGADPPSDTAGTLAPAGRRLPMTRLSVDGPTVIRAVRAAVANLE